MRKTTMITTIACMLFILHGLLGCRPRRIKPTPTKYTPTKHTKQQGSLPLTVPVRLIPALGAINIQADPIVAMFQGAKSLVQQIFTPVDTPLDPGTPSLTVINKQNNQLFVYRLTPEIKSIRVRSESSKSAELVIHNKRPLTVELWLLSDSEISLDIEYHSDYYPK